MSVDHEGVVGETGSRISVSAAFLMRGVKVCLLHVWDGVNRSETSQHDCMSAGIAACHLP